MLRDHFLPRGKPKVIDLYTELTSLRKGFKENITYYVIRAENAATLLKNAGETISDSLLIAMVLKGLTSEYKTFVTVVTQKDTPMMFSEFKTALRNYEETRKTEDTTVNKVMCVNERIASPPRQHNKNKFKGTCYICRKYGHRSFECRNKNQLKTQENWCGICKNGTHATKYCRRRKTAKLTTNSTKRNNPCFKVTKPENVVVDSCGTLKDREKNKHKRPLRTIEKVEKPTVKLKYTKLSAKAFQDRKCEPLTVPRERRYTRTISVQTDTNEEKGHSASVATPTMLEEDMMEDYESDSCETFMFHF